MNQIAHIIRKDLRHLRSLLLVWLGLLILQAVLTGGVHPFIDDIRTMDLLSNFVPLLSLMEFLLLTVIIAQLIQADSLVGSTAFWLTLPISRGGLLASKSILLVLFVILPTLLVEVVLHFANGITVFDVFRSIPQILIFPLLLTAIPMLLASLTPNLPRLVFSGITLVAALALLNLAIEALYTSTTTNVYVWWSATIVLPLFVFLGSLLVIVHQYLTRRTTLSTFLAASGVLLAVLIIFFWPWDILGFTAQRIEVLETGNVKARLDEETLTLNRSPRLQDSERSLRGNIVLDNLARDFLVTPTRISSHLSFPPDSVIRSETDHPFVIGFPGFSSRRLTEKRVAALTEALGNVVFLNSEAFILPETFPVLLKTTEAHYNQFGQDRGSYSAQVEFAVHKYQGTEIPLKRNSKYDRGSDHLRVVDVTRELGRLIVTLDESGHNFILDEWKEVRYVLHNAPKREALIASRRAISLTKNVNLTPFPDTLVIKRLILEFVSPHNAPPIDKVWLRTAKLVRVETRRVGRFSKSIQLDDLVLAKLPSP